MILSPEDFLQKAKEVASEDLPFVLFKYPNDSQLHLIYQNDTCVHTIEDFSGKGFIIHPFEGTHSFLLRQDNLFSTAFVSEERKNTFPSPILSSSARAEYQALFDKALKAIDKGELTKVVLSRRIAYTKAPKPLLTYFQDLVQAYPTAFCYAFSHPKIGKWVAATPETLVKIEDNQLRTMSLAGTKPFVEGEKPLWTEKEYREQQVVTDTIIKVLSPYTNDLSTGKIHEVRAGKLWHLCTEITAKIPSNTPIQEIVQRLHPTPAVCGFPTEKAREFLLENEGYPREFYAGYCGLVDFKHKNSLDLFVNLRCAQLSDKEVFVYVGGGVNSGSQEESEWQETENKAQTMLRILQ